MADGRTKTGDGLSASKSSEGKSGAAGGVVASVTSPSGHE